MSDLYQTQEITDSHQSALEELAWALEMSSGQFCLILARCNSASLRTSLMQRLRTMTSVEIREIVLAGSVKTLYTAIKTELGQSHPQVLMVSGLESISALSQALTTANQVREEFRKNFPFPLVLWITDEILQKLIILAPDFYSWATSVEFEIPSDELINFIEKTTEHIFAQVLEAGDDRLLGNAALNLGINSSLLVELKSAGKELRSRGASLTTQLEASLEFVFGIAANGATERSLQHYQRSLALWQQASIQESAETRSLSRSQQEISPSKSGEKLGCVLYFLGLWWCNHARQHRAEQQQAYLQAKTYFQQCVEFFEQINRQDLVAKFINAWAEILHKLEQWDELETVAHQALVLHQTNNDLWRLAQAHEFLAEVALAKSTWTEAQDYAQQARDLMQQALVQEENTKAATATELVTTDFKKQRTISEEEVSFHQGRCLLTLAKAKQHLRQTKEALDTLETAREKTQPEYAPELYIKILRELQRGYFLQGEYLTAFQFKQEQRIIEYQFRFRAFLGFFGVPRRMLLKRQMPELTSSFAQQQSILFKEITASGRRRDIDRLIERIGRNDYKLTVIHGPSGVGKSSNLQSGLVPILKEKTIGTREVVPVVQRVYTNWTEELSQGLIEALQYRLDSDSLLHDQFGYNAAEQRKAICDQLAKNAEQNLITVLIFDQFEEFFLLHKKLDLRKDFYKFLQEILDIPYVKVILSIREDYLYLLLECNRLGYLEVINNNILDKNILYYLDSFSPEEAKSVLQSLTEQAQFHLEESLIDELVKDLAGTSGKVRPIKLQVVGAQLQTDGISTLSAYQQIGEKERLVGRSIEEVVEDCGRENEQLAKIVLYLLTNEDNTRPLKTRLELEKELEELAADSAIENGKLDLVLKIFVESGLVFQLPEVNTDRYQLFHDYLVAPIRRQYEPNLYRLKAELEKERRQCQQVEAKVQRVRQELAAATAERDRINQEVREAQIKLKEAKAAREE